MKWTIVLLAAMFAGCLDSIEDIDEDSFDLTANGVPSQVRAGETFTFTLDIDGDLPATSDHVGAHYWQASTNDPDGDFSEAGGCAHQPTPTDLPGTVTVLCTIDDAGTIYLRGHVRLTGEETFNYWGAEHRIDVLDYTLAASGNGDNAKLGEDYTFMLTIAGAAGATSDHLGAHYWDSPPADPTAAFADQAGGCQHQAQPSEVPGSFSVTCNWNEAGTYTVHGHLRIKIGETQHNWWTPGFQVAVS